MSTEAPRSELITAGHPYYRNLPNIGEILVCCCGASAAMLVMVPSHRLELCSACYRSLAPYLDRDCRIVLVQASVV